MFCHRQKCSLWKHGDIPDSTFAPVHHVKTSLTFSQGLRRSQLAWPQKVVNSTAVAWLQPLSSFTVDPEVATHKQRPAHERLSLNRRAGRG